ncbi:hypothetical protein KFK09_028456 [Dendrobium nobile]|uniref:Uncharacterized protein n=1 Tax=Dendrobium nobile TaxID=94219 RepID=A0A8T3A353_DENNO|nr:hypothetical protein KFK09_028456 [Dendrobium nobile]
MYALDFKSRLIENIFLERLDLPGPALQPHRPDYPDSTHKRGGVLLEWERRMH